MPRLLNSSESVSLISTQFSREPSMVVGKASLFLVVGFLLLSASRRYFFTVPVLTCSAESSSPISIIFLELLPAEVSAAADFLKKVAWQNDDQT